MTSTVAMDDAVFGLPCWKQVGPVDESLAPTWRTPEGALGVRAVVKAPPTLPGYEILGELGHGGMAFVYKARDLRRHCLVAIKVSDPGLADNCEVVSRFREEQVLAVRLAHPNLVAAYDFGKEEGIPYLILEFVEGHDLAWIVKQFGPLPVAEACEVIRQAALGLEHLHKHGLVHRDVKPANLMLTLSRQVKVIDFGVARDPYVPAPGDQITLRGQFVGTPDYVAPEQCLDSHGVDGRADIYALGCMLYEFLAGHAPFTGPAHGSVFLKMMAHVETPVPPIRERRPDISERLAGILERMLAKDRADRFVSAAGVVAALRPFAAGADLGCLSLAPTPSATFAA